MLLVVSCTYLHSNLSINSFINERLNLSFYNPSLISLMASSSSHHVFLSFHGPDLHREFLSQVHNQFASKGIKTFHDQNTERGHTLGPESVKAIRESRISVVLISKNYASLSWRLDELVEIFKCKEALGQIVIPIFYDIPPSLVRILEGAFRETFEKTCEGKTEEGKLTWKTILKHIGSMSGEDSRLWSDEAAMVEKIATRISNILEVEDADPEDSDIEYTDLEDSDLEDSDLEYGEANIRMSIRKSNREQGADVAGKLTWLVKLFRRFSTDIRKYTVGRLWK